MSFDWGSLLSQAVPAAAGAAMQYFGKKQPAQTTQLPRFDPEQQGFMGFARQMAQRGLQDPTAGFEPIAQQAQERFRSQIAPGIAEQFAGLGATRSSAFPAALAGAGQGLAGDLAAQQARYGQQNISAMTRLGQLGLGQQFENIYQPEAPGQMQTIGSSMFGQGLGGLGQLGQQYFQGQQQRRATSQAIKEWQDAQQAIDKSRRAAGGQQPATSPTPWTGAKLEAGKVPWWSSLLGGLSPYR